MGQDGVKPLKEERLSVGHWFNGRLYQPQQQALGTPHCPIAPIRLLEAYNMATEVAKFRAGSSTTLAE